MKLRNSVLMCECVMRHFGHTVMFILFNVPQLVLREYIVMRSYTRVRTFGQIENQKLKNLILYVLDISGET